MAISLPGAAPWPAGGTLTGRLLGSSSGVPGVGGSSRLIEGVAEAWTGAWG